MPVLMHWGVNDQVADNRVGLQDVAESGFFMEGEMALHNATGVAFCNLERLFRQELAVLDLQLLHHAPQGRPVDAEDSGCLGLIPFR